MLKRTCLLVIIFCLCFSNATLTRAEKYRNTRKIGITLSGGQGELTVANWNFDYGLSDVNMQAGLYYSGGLAFGPIDFLSSTILIFSGEIAYLEVGTEETAIDLNKGSTAQLKISNTPIMIRSTLLTRNRLSPFIRFGLGATKIEFAEIYSPRSLESTRFDYWTFASEIGAGLQYSVSPSFDIFFVSELLFGYKDQWVKRATGRKTGIGDALSEFILGIGTTIWI